MSIDPEMPNGTGLENPYGQTYERARSEVLSKFRICQFCGQDPSSEAHHWRYHIHEKDTTANDLVAVCRFCHNIITEYRKFRMSGGDRWQFKHIFSEAIHKCFTE